MHFKFAILWFCLGPVHVRHSTSLFSSLASLARALAGAALLLQRVSNSRCLISDQDFLIGRFFDWAVGYLGLFFTGKVGYRGTGLAVNMGY